MLDSYNIRKIVPRMLIAIVGVNISIYLVIAAVDITNVIGGGLGSLIREPFLNTQDFQNLPINAGGGVVGLSATAGIVGLVGAGAATGFLGTLVGGSFLGLAAASSGLVLLVLLLAVLSALLITLAILVTVVIRYGAIILLALVSPIAIALLILPGTEKYFRQWWSIFLKTLLVYPIIAAVFAISDVMASIFLKAQVGNDSILGFVSIFVIIVVVYAPLFLIPFSFKMAGGILGQVFDLANKNMYGKAKPAFDNFKKNEYGMYGKAKRKAKLARERRGLTGNQIGEGLTAAGGHLFGRNARERRKDEVDSNNKFLREYDVKAANGTATRADFERASKILDNESHLPKSKAAIIREASAQYKKQTGAMHSTKGRLGAHEAIEKDEDVKTLSQIDEAGQAGKMLLKKGSAAAGKALREANNFQYDYLEGGISERESGVRRANHDRVMGLLGRVNSRYQDSAYMIHSLNDHGSAASSSGSEVMNIDALEMAGGDSIEKARVLADLREVAKNANRPDKSALGISTDIRLQSEAETRIADGENEGNVWREIRDQKLEAALARAPASQIVTAHPNALKQMKETITKRVQKAKEIGTPRALEKAAGQAATLYDAYAYAAPDNIHVLDDFMKMDFGSLVVAGPDGKPMTKKFNLRGAMEEMRGNPATYEHFANQRRDYGSERAAHLPEEKPPDGLLGG